MNKNKEMTFNFFNSLDTFQKIGIHTESEFKKIVKEFIKKIDIEFWNIDDTLNNLFKYINEYFDIDSFDENLKFEDFIENIFKKYYKENFNEQIHNFIKWFSSSWEKNNYSENYLADKLFKKSLRYITFFEKESIKEIWEIIEKSPIELESLKENFEIYDSGNKIKVLDYVDLFKFINKINLKKIKPFLSNLISLIELNNNEDFLEFYKFFSHIDNYNFNVFSQEKHIKLKDFLKKIKNLNKNTIEKTDVFEKSQITTQLLFFEFFDKKIYLELLNNILLKIDVINEISYHQEKNEYSSFVIKMIEKDSNYFFKELDFKILFNKESFMDFESLFEFLFKENVINLLKDEHFLSSFQKFINSKYDSQKFSSIFNDVFFNNDENKRFMVLIWKYFNKNEVSLKNIESHFSDLKDNSWFKLKLQQIIIEKNEFTDFNNKLLITPKLNNLVSKKFYNLIELNNFNKWEIEVNEKENKLTYSNELKKFFDEKITLKSSKNSQNTIILTKIIYENDVNHNWIYNPNINQNNFDNIIYNEINIKNVFSCLNKNNIFSYMEEKLNAFNNKLKKLKNLYRDIGVSFSDQETFKIAEIKIKNMNEKISEMEKIWKTWFNEDKKIKQYDEIEILQKELNKSKEEWIKKIKTNINSYNEKISKCCEYEGVNKNEFIEFNENIWQNWNSLMDFKNNNEMIKSKTQEVSKKLKSLDSDYEKKKNWMVQSFKEIEISKINFKTKYNYLQKNALLKDFHVFVDGIELKNQRILKNKNFRDTNDIKKNLLKKYDYNKHDQTKIWLNKKINKIQ